MSFRLRGDDEQVRIQLADDVSLFGAIRRHEQPQVPGMVVCVHGRLHRHDRGPPADIAASGKLPFDVFTFDARGCGRSTGVTGYANSAVRSILLYERETIVMNAKEEAEDLHVVVTYLRKRGESIVGIIGHSKGGVVMLLYASLYPPPCRLLVNLSGRYSSEGHDSAARFTEAQQQQLREKGEMTWLHYRAGEDGQERRPYVVTQEALGRHHSFTLGPALAAIPKSSHVLNVHGRSDGTVSVHNAERIDEGLKRAGIASDVLLLDGAAHNYDGPGETDLLASLVSSWMVARLAMPPVDPSRELVDHLNRNPSEMSSRVATPVLR